MPYFLNPFKKHDVSEFPGVLVPLHQAEHRNSIVSQRGLSLTSPPSQADQDEKNSRKDSDSRSGDVSLSAGVTNGVTTGLTVELLRAEIEADLAASDSKTAYDRKSCGYYIFVEAVSCDEGSSNRSLPIQVNPK